MTRSDYSAAEYITGDSYDDGLSLYSNGNVLPLAFSVPSGAYDFDFYSLENATGEKDYLQFRNAWFASLFPEEFGDSEYFIAPSEELIPEIVNGSVIDMSRYTGDQNVDEEGGEDDEGADDIFDYDDIGIEIEDVYRNDLTHVYRINGKLPIVLSYDIDIERDDELYLNISNARCMSGCSVYINGKSLASWSDGSFYSAVVRLGAFEEGEKINVSVVSDSDSFEYVDINFAYFDDDTFAEHFDTITTDDVQVISVNDGDVVINADLKAGDTVLTTIPCEDGWELTVDGVPQEIKVYQDALIGIDCGSGSHTIHLTFTPPGMKIGAVISVAGIIGIAVMAVVDIVGGKKKVPADK